MADNLLLETLDVLEGLGLVLGPGSTLGLGDGSCESMSAGVFSNGPVQ
jgi:hypothetical protein